MTNLEPTEIRNLTRLGPRAVYGQTMQNLAKQIPNLYAITADLGMSSGLERFRNSHSDRFINVGIAEQNMIGVASGISREGFIPFASSFAPFISMRASEQIRMNLGYMGMNVKLVAIGSGLSMGFLGNSHYGLEDVAIMRTIPGMTILCPADCLEVVKSVEAAASHTGPVYIRLTGAPGSPSVYSEDYDFQIGKSINLRIGTELAIISSGSMVARSMQAAELIQTRGVSASIFNMHTIKPLDIQTLKEIARTYKHIVTVEEHSVIGGLGSAVSDYLVALPHHPPLLMIGLKDEYGPTGEYEYLLKHHELTAPQICNRIINWVHLRKIT